MIAMILLALALIAVLGSLDDTHEKHYQYDAR